MQLSHRFTQALIFATELHSKQIRKGSGVPYISHLLGVSSIVLEYGADEEEAIAALLHDAIEDQGGIATGKEIRSRFGDRVADIVEGCTDSQTTPKPPWKQRKQAYLAHLANASPSILLVSSADKLYNARSILKDYRLFGDQIWTRFTGKKEGTLWYYQALVEAFNQRDIQLQSLASLIEEFKQVVLELNTLVK
jgi:(p)ppGpp synthase/HD superfamily hydrolase